jgi:hypothetical protein
VGIKERKTQKNREYKKKKIQNKYNSFKELHVMYSGEIDRST